MSAPIDTATTDPIIVVATMDDAGRLIIPQTELAELKLEVGSTVLLELKKENINPRVIAYKPGAYQITETDWGWPVVHFFREEKNAVDVVEQIREAREERATKSAGNR